MNKKMVLVMAAICLLAFSVPAFAAQPDVFADVPADHWSYKAVQKLAQDGIIVGDAGRFNGDKGLTRYEMAVFVGNAMTKLDKADAEQKKLIDKLSREYNAELTKLGARLAKVEAKSKVNFFFDNRIQYNYTSLNKTDKGGYLGASVGEKGQWMERIRIYMGGQIGDQWEWNSRLHQTKWNIDSSENDIKFDRFWVTNKEFLGGTLDLGKQGLFPGKGFFWNYVGDTEAAVYTKKIDNLTAKLIGARQGNAGTGFKNQGMSAFELTYRPTKTADIGLLMLKQKSPVAAFNDFEDLKVFSINGAMEIPNANGMALSFEWGKNKAKDNALAKWASGYEGDQSGYFIALQSKYRATNIVPMLYTSLVNPFVKGDSGWAISYRHMPTGMAGIANRATSATVAATTDRLGTFQNTFDGINAWRLDYISVPWKNVQWTLTYDHIKPIDKARQGNWTNNSYQSTFNFFF